MFLSPQHLQAFSREVTDRIHASESIGSPGDWGLVSLSIDEEALRRDTFRVLGAVAVFRDGCLASFPANATVGQRDFAEFFVDPTLDVSLGIPAIRPGVGGLSENGSLESARYHGQAATVFDENLSSAEREVDFKLLQARLFFGDEDRSGFECIKIARLVRKGKPEAYSALSPTYIPPVLCASASPVLANELAEIADQLVAQSRDLAARIPQTTLLASVEKGADVAAFVKLQAVNQCVPGAQLIRRLPELHPFQAYLQLIQAVGSLSIFSDSRTVPALEPYEHNDLDGCFGRAFEVIRDLIPREVSVPYDSEPFKDDPARAGLLVCDIPSNWIESDGLMFLGIRSDQTPEQVISLAPSAIKLTAEENLDNVLIGVTEGIKIEHARMPPLSFPKDDLQYYRIEAEGESRDAWLKVASSGRALIVRTDPAIASWEFSLFVELRN
ncbi:MAG: type VI secretion system protein ImpJ [Planctomycetota bacterium]|jgi:type VI secretion system protein ImpJ